jgi:Sulfotransferase family
MPSASAPVFVVCNARSGSTLLRWLIDAHDEISCPGETDIASLLNAYVDSAQATGLAFDEALVRAGAVVDDLMAAHLAEAGKARWCDKSLSNVTAMDRLAAAWPDARFVLLHRHAMDLIASALEASEWGLDGYGLAPYAQMSPTNGVIAVAGYWIERTAAMLDFEARHPGRCLRLRYEDLVTRTDVSMQGVWNLFGVDGSRRQADAFSGPHDPLAPADHKIWHTRAVNAESIGRGARIPPDRLGVPVRDSMNRLLTMLGYQQVDNFWGSGGGEVAHGEGNGTLEIRIIDGHVVLSRTSLDTFDAPTSDGTAPACVVTVERSTLDALCSRTENFGVALKRRTVRRYGDVPARFGSEKQFLDGLAAYLDTSGWGLLAGAELMVSATSESTQCDAASQH